jgi:hypothetical protein
MVLESTLAKIFNAVELKGFYGKFFTDHLIHKNVIFGDNHRISLNPTNIPSELQILLPYAEFWGISDDCYREDLLEAASAEILSNLVEAIAAYDDQFDTWLAGPEAYAPHPSAEYIAYSAMRMAADYAMVLLTK